jgi:hypothetical protein
MNKEMMKMHGDGATLYEEIEISVLASFCLSMWNSIMLCLKAK